MQSRRFNRLAAVAILLASAAGCHKSESPEKANPSSAVTPAAAPSPTVARVHWLGIKELAAETNSATFLRIWNQAESKELERQTLDKFASAPWRLLHRTVDTNVARLLRPLLDDVVQQESYLEIRQAPGQTGELAFAIRLDRTRAALWKNSVSRVFQSLTGVQPSAGGSGWGLRRKAWPGLVQLTTAGQWTVIGMAQDTNTLFSDAVSRLEHSQAPFTSESPTNWLEATVDLSRIAGVLLGDSNPSTSTAAAANWPRIALTAAGEGTNVHTHAEFTFARLPHMDLDPWNIPFSIMNGPLTRFTAARGFKDWVASLKAWQDFKIGPPPNQLFLWALPGQGMMTFAAAPQPEASNQVKQVTEQVLKNWDTWMPTNDLAKFKKSDKFNGLEWAGPPWLWPSLQSVALTNGNFLYASLFPNQRVSPPPPQYFDKVLAGTNLVYFNWEQTSTQVEQLLYIGQFARYVTHRAQIPFHGLPLVWLRAIGPHLGLSETHVFKTGPNQLALDRTSTIGLTAVELHLLVDWLESPSFPVGLHTFLAPLPKPPAGKPAKPAKPAQQPGGQPGKKGKSSPK